MAVFDDVSGKVITRRMVGRPMAVLDVVRELPRPLLAVYEAGPTGYGLVRRARAEGIEMVDCSPGNIERRPGDRIKTDKRDAIRLARLFAAGDLRQVWVPSEEHERLRDLVRCREDLCADFMRARRRLARFLLRRERTFPGRGALDAQAPSLALPAAVRGPGVRITQPTTCTRMTSSSRAATRSAASSNGSRRVRVGANDRATVLSARDRHPDRAEHSCGQSRRLGKITKAGSTHARRLLVEAALHYRLTPAVGGKLAGRQRGHDPALLHLWKHGSEPISAAFHVTIERDGQVYLAHRPGCRFKPHARLSNPSPATPD